MCLDQKRREHELVDLFCCFHGSVQRHHDTTSELSERHITLLGELQHQLSPVTAFGLPTGPIKNNMQEVRRSGFKNLIKLYGVEKAE
jgi:hypothetical protein